MKITVEDKINQFITTAKLLNYYITKNENIKVYDICGIPEDYKSSIIIQILINKYITTICYDLNQHDQIIKLELDQLITTNEIEMQTLLNELIKKL